MVLKRCFEGNILAGMLVLCRDKLQILCSVMTRSQNFAELFCVAALVWAWLLGVALLVCQDRRGSCDLVADVMCYIWTALGWGILRFCLPGGE